jgi:hypothetical protein
MLSASMMAFMPAFALHSARPRPNAKANVSLPSLLPAIRTTWSLMSWYAEDGITSPMKLNCLLMELAGMNRPYIDTSAVMAGTMASSL